MIDDFSTTGSASKEEAGFDRARLRLNVMRFDEITRRESGHTYEPCMIDGAIRLFEKERFSQKHITVNERRFSRQNRLTEKRKREGETGGKYFYRS